MWRYEKDVYLHGVPVYKKYESNTLKVLRFSLEGNFERVYDSADSVCDDLGVSCAGGLRASIKAHYPYKNCFWEYEKNFKNSPKMNFNYCKSNKKFSLGLFRDDKLIKFLGSVRNSSEILHVDRHKIDLFLDNQEEVFENTYIRKVSGIEIEYTGEGLV